jgi:polyvinyl alcohol dehydrogenase (cytochrome)
LKQNVVMIVVLFFVIVLPRAGAAAAQEQTQEAGWVAAQALFEKNCSTCHGSANSEVRAATRETLMKLPPEAIFAALTNGPMSVLAKDLTEEQKRLIAQHLSGRPFGSAVAGDAKTMPNRCATNPPLNDPSTGPAWNGWGSDDVNTRFQAAQDAGITAAQVPHLKLKWAFGFPHGAEIYSQPAIVSGRVFIGGDTGFLYSLDAATGCIYWSFQAQAGVRTAPSVGPVKGKGGAKYAVYFGDMRANVYALDAATGELLWKQQVEDHPMARIVGAPKLYNRRLYVPVSSGEEGISANPLYPCCTFRGSVVALDADTGRQVWKSYTIPGQAKPTKKNSAGTQLWGPAGAAVWNSPTIDVKRRALYVGTGDAYTEPASKTSDAIIAFDLDKGEMLWSFQDIKNDAWMEDCDSKTRNGNCPEKLGPDYDFSTSPILRTLPNGRQVLVVSGKSGYVLALNPDKNGAVVWKTSLAEKPPDYTGLIVFGGAADEQAAYFALNQVGGMAALWLTTGERKWFTRLAPADIPGEPPRPGQSAAVTGFPGIVFSGGWDGTLRALSTENGRVVWEYNTLRDYTTVNGVAAKGGSMGAPGPTVAGGMLFVGSGYVGFSNGLPGNVLLAFSPE